MYRIDEWPILVYNHQGMKHLLLAILLTAGMGSYAQLRPHGARWLCTNEGYVAGSILGNNIYDANGVRKYYFQQAQVYSTPVGRYGGAPLGASRCSQYELYDIGGRACGCVEHTWTGTVVRQYSGQPVWNTCE